MVSLKVTKTSAISLTLGTFMSGLVGISMNTHTLFLRDLGSASSFLRAISTAPTRGFYPVISKVVFLKRSVLPTSRSVSSLLPP